MTDTASTHAAQAGKDSTPAGQPPGRLPINYAARRPTFKTPRELRWPLLVLAVTLAALFSWTLARMFDRWQAPAGYYSHGPLILPIALVTAWLIIRARGLPMHSTPWSRRLALAMLAVAMVGHLASMFARVTFVSGFMLLPAMAACVLYLGGFAMLSRLWFPIAFLAFMIPLPDLTIYNINFKLKMVAAQASTAIVNGLGTPAFLKGSDIFLPFEKHLTVEDACSGLKSLISLLAFATLFAYACKLRGYKRLLLFLSAVPIAIAANIVRISVLTMVAHHYDPTLCIPGGWVHDLMGFVVFVIAFLLMFMLEELLDLLPGARSGLWLGSTLVPHLSRAPQA